MRYYAVELNGMSTEAKAELTSRFQWVHEYYMGCNMDGTGPDQLADHHIHIRLDNEDKLIEVLADLDKKYNVRPFLYEVSAMLTPPFSDKMLHEIFIEAYKDKITPPVPYRFSEQKSEDDEISD